MLCQDIVARVRFRLERKSRKGRNLKTPFRKDFDYTKVVVDFFLQDCDTKPIIHFYLDGVHRIDIKIDIKSLKPLMKFI